MAGLEDNLGKNPSFRPTSVIPRTIICLWCLLFALLSLYFYFFSVFISLYFYISIFFILYIYIFLFLSLFLLFYFTLFFCLIPIVSAVDFALCPLPVPTSKDSSEYTFLPIRRRGAPILLPQALCCLSRNIDRTEYRQG